MRSQWFAAALLALALAAQAQTASDDKLSRYLVDLNPAAISAAGLVGVEKTLVSEPQTFQDLVVALKPFASGNTKTGFGIALTPARTAITPMSGSTYLGNTGKPDKFNLARLAGSLTLSYAQSSADIAGASYDKAAVALETHYFIDVNDDPIAIGARAFHGCSGAPAFVQRRKDLVSRWNNGLSDDEYKKEGDALNAEINVTCKAAIDKALKDARWNAARIALSWGEGRIRSDQAGFGSHTLGRAWTLNGVVPIGKEAALYASVRRVRDALDLSSIGGTMKSANTTLAAVRLTYGSENDASLRFLAEASNAKKNVASEFNNVYLRALGLDKKIAKGIWLEFRVGRSRTSSTSDGEQTTSLLNLKLAPSAFLFASEK